MNPTLMNEIMLYLQIMMTAATNVTAATINTVFGVDGDAALADMLATGTVILNPDGSLVLSNPGQFMPDTGNPSFDFLLNELNMKLASAGVNTLDVFTDALRIFRDAAAMRSGGRVITALIGLGALHAPNAAEAARSDAFKFARANEQVADTIRAREIATGNA